MFNKSIRFFTNGAITSIKTIKIYVKTKGRGGILKYIFAILLSLILIFVGCSSDEEKVISKLKSEIEGKHSVVIFDNEMPSEEFHVASITT